MNINQYVGGGGGGGGGGVGVKNKLDWFYIVCEIAI